MIEAPAEATIVFPVTLDDDPESDDDLLTVEQVSLDDILPYANNPKDNEGAPVEKVMASLKAFGWKQPMVLDDDNEIVVGHVRFDSAVGLYQAGVRVRGARYGHAPVIRASDLSEEEVRAYRIADQRTGLEAKFNRPKLRDEMMQLDELSFNLGPLGFDEKEEVAILASDGVDFSEKPDKGKSGGKTIECPSCGYEWTRGGSKE